MICLQFSQVYYFSLFLPRKGKKSLILEKFNLIYIVMTTIYILLMSANQQKAMHIHLRKVQRTA